MIKREILAVLLMALFLTGCASLEVPKAKLIIIQTPTVQITPSITPQAKPTTTATPQVFQPTETWDALNHFSDYPFYSHDRAISPNGQWMITTEFGRRAETDQNKTYSLK